MNEKLGTILKELCNKYNFKTKFTGENDKYYCEVYSKNTDGNQTLWFDIQLSDHDDNETFEPIINIYGNTDQKNIWLCETRKDLTMKDGIEFCKNIARICDCKLVTHPTDEKNEIYIHHLIDLEDLQELKTDESMEELFNKLEKHNIVVDKLFINSFNIWKNYLKNENNDVIDDELLNDLKSDFRTGLFGVENELDSLRVSFEINNKENPYFEDLDNLWDCFNWYKDYLQDNNMDEDELYDLVSFYLIDDSLELSLEDSDSSKSNSL